MHPDKLYYLLQICVEFLLEWQCDSVQHLFLLLSSAHRHQSACPLQCPALDRKHEQVCLWVRQMDTSHHVLHNVIQAKHEIETTEKSTFFHVKENYRLHLNESVEFSSQCMMTLPWLAARLLLKLPMCLCIGLCFTQHTCIFHSVNMTEVVESISKYFLSLSCVKQKDKPTIGHKLHHDVSTACVGPDKRQTACSGPNIES